MSTFPQPDQLDGQYQSVVGEVSGIIAAARRSAARSVNAVMTGAYWLIGRYIVEFEQSGEDRAKYGTKLVGRLSKDLTHRFGRGFGSVNLSQMKYVEVDYPGSLRPVWIRSNCVDGTCRTFSSHPKLWYFRSTASRRFGNGVFDPSYGFSSEDSVMLRLKRKHPDLAARYPRLSTDHETCSTDPKPHSGTGGPAGGRVPPGSDLLAERRLAQAETATPSACVNALKHPVEIRETEPRYDAEAGL